MRFRFIPVGHSSLYKAWFSLQIHQLSILLSMFKINFIVLNRFLSLYVFFPLFFLTVACVLMPPLTLPDGSVIMRLGCFRTNGSVFSFQKASIAVSLLVRHSVIFFSFYCCSSSSHTQNMLTIFLFILKRKVWWHGMDTRTNGATYANFFFLLGLYVKKSWFSIGLGWPRLGGGQEVAWDFRPSTFGHLRLYPSWEVFCCILHSKGDPTIRASTGAISEEGRVQANRRFPTVQVQRGTTTAAWDTNTSPDKMTSYPGDAFYAVPNLYGKTL